MMEDGYIKCAAAGLQVSLADPMTNAGNIVRKMKEVNRQGVKVLVFPELALSGCTCGDLFFQESLLKGCKDALRFILQETKTEDVLTFIGLPFSCGGAVYDAAAVILRGKLLGVTVKSGMTENSENREERYFADAPVQNQKIDWDGETVLLGSRILMRSQDGAVIGCEIGTDFFKPHHPAEEEALAGAGLIVHPHALAEGGTDCSLYPLMVQADSRRLCCAYLCAAAGLGESSTDYVYGGQSLIAENGVLLQKAEKYQEQTLISDIDFSYLNMERRKRKSFPFADEGSYDIVSFVFEKSEAAADRTVRKQPFLTEENGSFHRCLQEIFERQVQGLVRRLSHIHCSTAVLGLSGGLDSTLAILVAAKAMDVLNLDRKGIISVTMPCFGTTDRTYQNACRLAKELGTGLKEISIKDAVTKHFEDISHDIDSHDITYENAQARERTQVLMDLANQLNGIVIGTGDLSELALGWATYSGDLMSMYAVNASVPKTVVRLLVEDLAENLNSEELKTVLKDILDTPVSPELLPPVNGCISQKTEESVGPYELHDFFIYHMCLNGTAPAKVYRMAVSAFDGEYSEETVLKWLKVFCRRFFAQQFKRSCMPDGPRATAVSFSPRGGLCMPSDAVADLWMKELEQLS